MNAYARTTIAATINAAMVMVTVDCCQNGVGLAVD